jgi:GWxTD domain-containing protein
MRDDVPAFALVLSLLLPSIAGRGQAPALASKYKTWLEDISTITTTLEREVFQKLGSDEDRDRFIEEFWKQRDPTPGTPTNEFKDEHYRRLAFADKTFGRGTPFLGRKTERGRIYIILGPPIDVERIMSSDAYPMEIWHYTGNPALGQAPFFRLLFYQKFGGGDYSLYNPGGNSPKDLVTNPRRVPRRPEDPIDWDEWDVGAYLVMKDRLPISVAESVFSIIPGNQGKLIRVQSSILLAEVQKYPQKRVNDDYALAILEHRPVVEVSYSARFIGNRTAIAVAEEPSGAPALHYVIVPDRISFDSYGDKYFAGLKIAIRIADRQGKTLFQQEKSHSLELHSEELKKVSADSFQLYDSIPLIPGNWVVNLLLENTVSKEFTPVEKEVEVPPAGAYRMTPIVLARKAFAGPAPAGGTRAYQLGAIQLYPSVDNVFREKDPVYVFFQLLNVPPAIKDRAFAEYALIRDGQTAWTVRKAVKDYSDPRFILEVIPAEKVTAGTSTVSVVLQDENRTRLQAAETQVRIVKENLPGLWVVALSNPPADDPFYDFVRGTQHLNAGEIDKGAEELAKAYKKRPDSVEYAVGCAQSLLKTGNPARAREVLLPLTDSPDARFDFFCALGQAAKGYSDYGEAVKWLGKALSFRGNVVEALNAMGECYLELGEKERAAEAFKKSLAVNPNQERIKELIKKIG